MHIFKNLLLAGAAMFVAAGAAHATTGSGSAPQHVLLLSVDGMHEVDLRKWIASHPAGALAQLAQRGTVFSNAYTTSPSDSFPGMIAQVTGATAKSAGVYYDDSYDRTFFPPSSNCAGMPGAETTYAENIDKSYDPALGITPDITGGGTLGDPISQIGVGNLPMTIKNGTCSVVYPHEFIRVNTLFEVLKAHGHHTAWSDKHPAYEILNGPSGQGIEDLYTPEINSQLPGGAVGVDFTKSFKGTRDYDQIKVNAVINEINGKNSVGDVFKGYVPAILGMNFQAVSVGQKLAKAGYGDDSSLRGGYVDAGGTPGNALTLQLQFIDNSVGAMVSALQANGLYDQTVIIISAKHGQSPIDRTLRRAVHDGYADVLANTGYGFNIADDASLIWLNPQQRTPANLAASVAALKANAGVLGIQAIVGPDQLKYVYQDPATDSRTPDFYVISQHGVVYTGGSKLSEHGGVADDDRHVAMLVSGKGLTGQTVGQTVFTTQIAPTILSAFGISPTELQGVVKEGTRKLPGLPY